MMKHPQWKPLSQPGKYPPSCCHLLCQKGADFPAIIGTLFFGLMTGLVRNDGYLEGCFSKMLNRSVQIPFCATGLGQKSINLSLKYKQKINNLFIN
jgi:hypothetical protein